MSIAIKRLLLIVPMVLFLFAVATTQQHADTGNSIKSNTINTTAFNVAKTLVNNIEEPTALYQVGVEILCDEIEIFEIPPIFGFGGATVGFGTGCGENSDQDCVASAILLGGKLVVHVECSDSQ